VTVSLTFACENSIDQRQTANTKVVSYSGFFSPDSSGNLLLALANKRLQRIAGLALRTNLFGLKLALVTVKIF
jgi:hypothetical protein